MHIVGYGRLGRETARLAKAYGCKVIAATSDGTLKTDEESKEMCPGFGDPEGTIPSKYYSTKDENAFTEFLGQTDVLVICLPGSPGTIKMINKDRLARLKKDAVLGESSNQVRSSSSVKLTEHISQHWQRFSSRYRSPHRITRIRSSRRSRSRCNRSRATSRWT